MTSATPPTQGSEGPRSYTSWWLRAEALDWRDERDRQYDNIQRTGSWTYGRAALVGNAFRAAIRLHLADDTTATAIRDFTLATLTHFGHPEQLVYLEIEWKIREALGEDLPLEILHAVRSLMAGRLLFGYIADLRSSTRHTIDALLTDAERTTVRANMNPIPPAEQAETGVDPTQL